MLDGAVQRDGERLRISVNLLRIRDGTSLWADTFNVRFTDIFAVQDEVARQVAAQLRFKLSTEERARLARQTTANPEAHEYYLKGVGHLDRGRSGGADVQPAIVLFKKAVGMWTQTSAWHMQSSPAPTHQWPFLTNQQSGLG